jgi:hypothetical protein
MATTSIADDVMPGSNRRRGKASDSNATSTALPGYLTAPKKTPSVPKTKSSQSNPYETRSEYTGEGGKQSENTRSKNYPPGNATQGKSQPYSGGTSWSAVDGKRSKPSIAYNAWDNVGRIHSQYRAPSQSTALTGSTGLSSRLDAQSVSSGLAGGWAKQTSAVNRSSDTPNRPDTQPVSLGQAGGWAKQVSFAASVAQPEHRINAVDTDASHAQSSTTVSSA